MLDKNEVLKRIEIEAKKAGLANRLADIMLWGLLEDEVRDRTIHKAIDKDALKKYYRQFTKIAFDESWLAPFIDRKGWVKIVREEGYRLTDEGKAELLGRIGIKLEDLEFKRGKSKAEEEAEVVKQPRARKNPTDDLNQSDQHKIEVFTKIAKDEKRTGEERVLACMALGDLRNNIRDRSKDLIGNEIRAERGWWHSSGTIEMTFKSLGLVGAFDEAQNAGLVLMDNKNGELHFSFSKTGFEKAKEIARPFLAVEAKKSVKLFMGEAPKDKVPEKKTPKDIVNEYEMALFEKIETKLQETDLTPVEEILLTFRKSDLTYNLKQRNSGVKPSDSEAIVNTGKRCWWHCKDGVQRALFPSVNESHIRQAFVELLEQGVIDSAKFDGPTYYSLNAQSIKKADELVEARSIGARPVAPQR